MTIVYHPEEWAHSWPTGAKPYASAEAAQKAHPESRIKTTPYSGPVDADHVELGDAPVAPAATAQTPEEKPAKVTRKTSKK